MPILDTETLQVVGKERSFESGDIIFETGEVATSAYYLKSGSVRLATRRFDGTPVTFETITDGIFGEVAAITNTARLATAFAAGPVKVVEISSEALLSLVDRDKQFRHMVLTLMASRLNRSAELLQKAAEVSVDDLVKPELSRTGKLIDRLAAALGTVGFVGVVLVVGLVWMLWNTIAGKNAFDAGFIYLGLALSFISVAVTSIVLHSQNRNEKQMAKRKEVEFHTTMLAQRQIETLHTRLTELEQRLHR